MFCRPKIAQLGKDFVEIDPSWVFSTVTVDGVQKIIVQKPVWDGGGGTNLLPVIQIVKLGNFEEPDLGPLQALWEFTNILRNYSQ